MATAGLCSRYLERYGWTNIIQFWQLMERWRRLFDIGGIMGILPDGFGITDIFSKFMEKSKQEGNTDNMLQSQAMGQMDKGLGAMPQLQQFQATMPTQGMQNLNPMAGYMQRYYRR
jgi:hypothetical protein